MVLEVPIQRRPSRDPPRDPRPHPGDEPCQPVVGRARIHNESLELGIEVAQSTVAKYRLKRPRRPGQSWTAFLHNHATGIAVADMFVVPTMGKLLYCLVFLTHGRRELVHHAVTAHPTAEWVARQMTEAFS